MADDDGKVLLTIFLKHDQSRNLEYIQGTLGERAWWDRFPPEGVEIVSWYVVMGIGQIVTLRMAPDKVAVVNVEIERSAWGVFTTEFFPTYDFVPVRERIQREWRQARQAASGGDAGPAQAGEERYINPIQSRNGAPTAYENALGDAIEAAYADGIHELPDLVAALEAAGIKAPDGASWTEESFAREVGRLGA